MKISNVFSKVMSKSPQKGARSSIELEMPKQEKEGTGTAEAASKKDRVLGFFQNMKSKVLGDSGSKPEEQKSLVKLTEEDGSEVKEATPERQVKKRSTISDQQSKHDMSLSQYKKTKNEKKKSKQIHKGQVRNNSLAASKKEAKNSKGDNLDKSDLNPARQNETLQDDEDENDRAAYDDRQEKNCDLCNRPRPIFVVETDDMIKRQPEQHLSELLKNLKKDFMCKRQYLKYLRINAKHITACNCENRVQHAYCVTAQVVRSQKIYCQDCGAYYHLYVKSEKLCSQELFGVIGRYICLFILLIGFAQCTLLLDSFLKQKHEDEELIDSQVTATELKAGDVDDLQTVQTGFSFSRIENWIVMAPLTIILGIIMIWCFYFRFMKAIMARKRLIWVEVLDKNSPDFYISRYQAKQNLHLVGEITQKLRSYNYLFDKYWYRQREFQYIEAISQIEKRLFFNTLTDQQIKDMETGRPMITESKTINLQDLDTPNIVERVEEKTEAKGPFGNFKSGGNFGASGQASAEKEKPTEKKEEAQEMNFSSVVKEKGFEFKKNSPFNVIQQAPEPSRKPQKKEALNTSLDLKTEVSKINQEISKEEDKGKERLVASKQPTLPEEAKDPLPRITASAEPSNARPKEIRSMSIISFQPTPTGAADSSPKRPSKSQPGAGNQSGGPGSSLKNYQFQPGFAQYKFKPDPAPKAEPEIKKDSPLDQIDKVGFNIVKNTIKLKNSESSAGSGLKRRSGEGTGSVFHNYKLQPENSAGGSPEVTKPPVSPPLGQPLQKEKTTEKTTTDKPNSSTTDAIDKISFEADLKKDSSSNSENRNTRILSEDPKVQREAHTKLSPVVVAQGGGGLLDALEESQPSSLLAHDSLYSTLESPKPKGKVIKQQDLKIDLIQEKETEEEEGYQQSHHQLDQSSFKNKSDSPHSVENANFSLDRPAATANLTTEVEGNHALFKAPESIIEVEEKESGDGPSSLAERKIESSNSSLPIPSDSIENPSTKTNGDLKFAEIVNQEASKVQDAGAPDNNHEVLDISDKDLQAMVESVWERYDADHSGALDKIETQMFLNDILKEQGRPAIRHEEFNKFFQEFDTNNNGEIEKLEMEVFLKRFIFSSVDILHSAK